MFDSHTEWTYQPCWYVVARHKHQRAWLAGPYRTYDEAAGIAVRCLGWALGESGDGHAARYGYQVYQHYDGQVRSILGELKPRPTAKPG
jgi:hypothetical protein